MVTVVVGGKPGSGSSTAARLLAKRLGLRFFSAGDYWKKFGTGKETERALSFWKTKKAQSASFNNDLDGMVRKEAEKGNIVIDTKLGIKLLKDVYDIGVWLDVSLPERIRRYAKRDRISIEEAARLVNEKDATERTNFRRIYGFDTFDQYKIADVVVRSDTKTPDKVVEEILAEMRARGLTE